MHSSRKCTVRCSGRLMGRGCLPGGRCLPGVFPGGCLPRWVCLSRRGVCHGMSAQGDIYTPRGQNSWHTAVKTLPFRNFICGWYFDGYLYLSDPTSHLYLPPTMKLGQGYIFTGMFDSVHRRVCVCVWRRGCVEADTHTPRNQTPPWDQVHPPGTRHPRDQVYSPRNQTPPWKQTPLHGTNCTPRTRYTPQEPDTPLGPGTPPRNQTPPRSRHPP